MYSGTKNIIYYILEKLITIKGGSRRDERIRKVLMMMRAAKLGWAGAGAGKERGWGRSRAGQEQGQGGQGRRVILHTSLFV